MDGSLESFQKLTSYKRESEREIPSVYNFIKNEGSKKDPFKGNGDMKKQYFLFHASIASLCVLGAFFLKKKRL